MNGKVVAEINFGDDIAIRLATEKTHNNGEWTWVEMNRQRHRGKEEGTTFFNYHFVKGTLGYKNKFISIDSH